MSMTREQCEASVLEGEEKFRETMAVPQARQVLNSLTKLMNDYHSQCLMLPVDQEVELKMTAGQVRILALAFASTYLKHRLFEMSQDGG